MTRSAPYKCIYSGEEITELNNSKAHIFPNAIGGKLKPKNILTKKSNAGNIKKIEDDFINLFKDLLALIDPVRDRRAPPRQHYTSELNEKYIQSRGGVFLEHVRTQNHPINKAYINHAIIFGDTPKIKRFQNYDLTKIIAALYVFAIMFFAHKGGNVSQNFKLFVDKPELIISHAGIYFCPLSKSKNITRSMDSICHIATISTDKNKISTRVYIEILEIMAAVIHLPYTEGIIPAGYSIDITKGSPHDFEIEDSFFDDLTYVNVEGYVNEHIKNNMHHLLMKVRTLQFNRFIIEALREAIGEGSYSDVNFRLNAAYDCIALKYKTLQSPTVING